MKVAGYNIPARSIAFFADKEPIELYQALKDAGNAVELKHRLTWMSEGSMMYQLGKMKGPWQHGGCPTERYWFRAFVSELARRGHQL